LIFYFGAFYSPKGALLGIKVGQEKGSNSESCENCNLHT